MANQKDVKFNIKTFVDDPKGEMKAALDVFGTSIIPFFEASSDVNIDIINDYNGIIIALLAHEKNFKVQLENALMNSREKINEQSIRLDKKLVDPTIQNWLKDFIKENGTDNFSNVVLSKYITRSANCKNLTEQEKKLVRKLLILYRNLKFFPESLKDTPIERWEIIPVERQTRDTVRDTKLTVPKTEAEKEIDNLKEEEGKYGAASLEREVLEETIDDKERIESLKAEATKYREGSLEHQAIEEEIKKLTV